MRAFHTFRTRQNSTPADFEIFTMILSALEWRRHNGEIFMVTDSGGAKILADLELAECWNGVDDSLDQFGNFGIDEKIFWAGAKLYALTKQPLPCVMIDLDFIVWRHVDFEKFADGLAVIRRESADAPCYPDARYFRFKNNFALPENLNWKLEPCNAALVYFGNAQFVAEYSSFAFEFMRASAPENLQGWDLLPYMVFVEQRWMAMCAEQLGVPVHSLSNLQELFGGQKFFTHVWGYKTFLRDNPSAAEKFCRDCAARISHDFPALAEKFSRLDWSAKYF